MEFKPKNIDFMKNFWTRFEDLPFYSIFATEETFLGEQNETSNKLWIKIDGNIENAVSLDGKHKWFYFPEDNVHEVTKITIEWEL